MQMPRMIASAINHVARQTIGKDWLLYAALLDHWPEIVGQEYAQVTTPVKITFPHQPHEARRQNGTLFIALPKGLAMEFSFKSEAIRQKINAYFGYEAVTRVVPEPTLASTNIQKASTPRAISPAVQSQVNESVKDLDNSELRIALQSLGEVLLSTKAHAPKAD